MVMKRIGKFCKEDQGLFYICIDLKRVRTQRKRWGLTQRVEERQISHPDKGTSGMLPVVQGRTEHE